MIRPWEYALTMGEVFNAHLTQRPDKTALTTTDGHSVTFAQLEERTNCLFNALSAQGIQPADRVAILSYNRPEYMEVFGLSKTGVIVVPLNWRLAAPELLRLLQHSGSRALIVEENFVPIVESLRNQLDKIDTYIVIGKARNGWIAYEDLVTKADRKTPEAQAKPDDVLCLVYTSGTTGAPKGVKITHRGALENCRSEAQEMLSLTEDDYALAVLPLFHVGGMWYHLFPSFATGCTSLLMPQFDPEKLLQAMQDWKITNVHLVPTMVGALLNHPRVDQFDLTHLRIILYAASSMPAEVLRRAMRTFHKCSFAQAYGSTEAGTVTGLYPEDHILAQSPDYEHILSSCGKPFKNRQIRILNANDQEVATGEIGELTVRSPGIMTGYWNDDAATRTTFQNGWVYTGDLARRDEQGYYYIVDRKNDMIVTGGENVYPTEVEAYLYADSRILEAAVFGIADPKWVEKVVAAVVLKSGEAATENELIQQLRNHLAAYKCPKEIYFVSVLPKSGAGKVLRKSLRNQYSQ
ncbi:MAG: long-chain fatty acid--CoA ligase [Alcaligenaceae bacterium]|jgi:acyl-CoA synthetase (AMP-forming)/AMP-acid ligase II|nr:long-chain fatty acid--CoA ligase [Alcaligenaceae bacterium]